ncbi:MAG TPA: Ppx/GppA phosphatase family protein [Terriglobales bacterium]|nr:Ppx/GppA phosphatase family protein [Terriglobales bacterium]
MPIFAAVDIGANSCRLKIAALETHRLRVIHEDREVTRLGGTVFSSGILDPQAIDATVKVLRRFHKATQTFHADQVKVVATSALRDAQNAASFVEWVRSVTGWRVEVISGLEEGRLIHLGVLSRGHISASRLMLVDLGGGSCEVTVSVDGQIRSMISLPLGAVRLTQEFLPDDPPKKKQLERMQEFIAEEISRLRGRMRKGDVQMTIATSGTAAALAGIAAGREDVEHGKAVTVPRAALNRITSKLSKLSLEQRKKLPGLGPRRAEIIIAGAFVYRELIERIGLPGFRYSALGLRDGLLAQMAAEYDRRASIHRRIESERIAALRETAAKYAVQMSTAEHVQDLALQLFHELRQVHRLPPDYREWISAAAVLSDAGSFINRTGRHRHTYYLIANSEIFGYSTEQRRVIAAIARYLGKTRPSTTDRPIRSVPLSQRSLIPRAVVLLRMARALDQGRRGAVKRVKARVNDGTVLIKLETKRGGAELESWSLSKEAAYFREVFGRDLAPPPS